MYRFLIVASSALFLLAGCSDDNSTVIVDCGRSVQASGAAIDCSGDVDTDEPNASAPTDPCEATEQLVGPWVRGDGDAAALSPVEVDGDGWQWLHDVAALDAAEATAIEVDVRFTGSTAMILAPGQCSVVAIDGDNGAGLIVTPVIDEPSASRHTVVLPLSEPIDAADFLRVVVQAPQCVTPLACGLVIEAAPRIRRSCS